MSPKWPICKTQQIDTSYDNLTRTIVYHKCTKLVNNMSCTNIHVTQTTEGQKECTTIETSQNCQFKHNGPQNHQMTKIRRRYIIIVFFVCSKALSEIFTFIASI